MMIKLFNFFGLDTDNFLSVLKKVSDDKVNECVKSFTSSMSL